MSEEAHSPEELEAALAALNEPGALEEAQRLVGAHAPDLQRILDQALDAGGWFDPAHQQAVFTAASVADPDDRVTAVRTLLAEETRVSMLIGVAVGYALARELNRKD